MTTVYEYQSDFARMYVAEGRAEGRAEGEATALLAVLAARGVELSPQARQEILDCTDQDRLLTWIRRAATAETIDDILH